MDHTTFRNGNSVDVIFDGGGWLVRVVEDGREDVMSFAFQQHAETFADGQRARLLLPFPAGIVSPDPDHLDQT